MFRNGAAVRNFPGGVVLAVLACGAALAQTAPPSGLPSAPAGAPAGKTVLLWPNGAPGAKGSTDADKPTLTIYLPAKGNPTKTAVVIAPGGGYAHLSMIREGSDAAHWLTTRGVAAFVLAYRLGPRYRYPAEREDAQRAIRMVRVHAAEYGVAEDRVGMWGFSAGGHLAATVGTHFDMGEASASDGVERVSSRPDFLVLAYPVISLEAPAPHSGSKKNLLGDNPDPKLVHLLSANLQVTKDTPPTFLFSTTDDKIVPVINSVLFYTALVKANVPAELHVFQHGTHGAGLATTNPQLSVWPDLLVNWMRLRGYMAANPQ